MIDPNRYAEACHQNDKLTKENAALREAVREARRGLSNIMKNGIRNWTWLQKFMEQTAKLVKEGE